MAQKTQRLHGLGTPANMVTCIRICLIPVLVILMLVPWGNDAVKPWAVMVLFALISLTDSLDGYLARSRNEITTFGKFMDPIADKLLVMAAMIAMVELDVLPSWVPLVILAREFLVSGLRMVAASAGVVIAASYVGKAKTLVTMIAIALFMVKDSRAFAAIPGIANAVSWTFMIVAVILTIVSMVDYFVKAKGILFDEPHSHSEAEHVASSSSERETVASTNAPQTFDLDASQLHKVSPEEVIAAARDKKAVLATAESLTGGLVSASLTSVPGSSEVVAGGVASYMPSVKVGVLHVASSTIEEQGVVSEQTAAEMASGALRALGATVAVSMTGVAGPGGGTPETPVGTVCLGLSIRQRCERERVATITEHFSGSRDEVRQATVECALSLLAFGIEELS